MTLNKALPDWAITDEEIQDGLLPEGWIREYVDYAQTVTDAPLAYHFATAIACLGKATSQIDIRVYSTTENERLNKFYQLPTTNWIAIVGLSGDRKSYAMKIGMDMLERAQRGEIFLPNDGSLEAWTDYLVQHNDVVMFRDELSYLFSQSRRSYMDGLKDWLLTLHSGKRYERTTRSRRWSVTNKTADMDETEQGRQNEHLVIERPRVNIIGAVPPEVFRAKGDKLDWSSGFFARFMFIPAIRTRNLPLPAHCSKTELRLAKWLADVPSRLHETIKIPVRTTKVISMWYDSLLDDCQSIREDRILSHVTRYQDLAIKLTAMNAVSRLRTPEKDDPIIGIPRVIATPEDAARACDVLDSIMGCSLRLFNVAIKEDERKFEDEVYSLFVDNPTRWFDYDNIDEAFPGIARRKLTTTIKRFVEDDRLRTKKVRPKGNSRGRKRTVFGFCGEL